MTIYDPTHPPHASHPPPSHPLPLLLILVVVNLLVLTLGIASSAARVNRTCGQLHDDLPSRTALAAVVFEGRAQRAESLPSWAKQVDREHFNVTFKPRNLYKGDLPRNPEGGFSVITVGTFGVVEDRNACIPSVQLRSRYIVFLRGEGTPSDYNRQLSFYEIFSFPEPFSPEGASLAAEYACANCTSLPTATLVPNEVEVKVRQKLPLRCVVTGKPSPIVTWFKDGRELTAAKRFRLRKTKFGSSLRINKVRTEDAGSYYCSASNVLAEVQSNVSLVSVAPASSFKPHAVLCSTQSFCLNGGVCYTIPTLGRKFCECRSQFTGLRCQDRELEPLIWRLLDGHDKLKLETLLIAFILIVVILLLFTLFCVFCAICRMQGKYSKFLLNSSRSKQSLRLDRMVALATANHLPSYCDTSVQTDPVHTNNRCLPNDISMATNCALPMTTNKYNVCVTTRPDQQACSSSAPAACGVSVATGCNVAMATSGTKSSNPASSAACHQRHSKVFVSNGGVPYSAVNGNKLNGGCNERPNSGCNKRLSTGASVVAKGCNPRLSSSPDCNQIVGKPTSTVVTIATIVTEPNVVSKRESCVSTATVTVHNAMIPGNVSPMIDCNRESLNVGSAVGCGDGRVAGCKPIENGLRQNQAPKRYSGNCSKRSSAAECDDAAAAHCNSQLPKMEDFGEKNLQIVNQEDDVDVLCCVKADVVGSSPPKQSHQQRTRNCTAATHNSSPPPPPPLPPPLPSTPPPPPVSNNVNGDCDKSPPNLCFTFDIPPSSSTGCSPIDKHPDLNSSECLNFDPKEVGNSHHHHHHRNQRSVHTVPKHGVNSNSKQQNNVLADRSSSDYERNSPASDLEVNMESEADIQALNASEEELGRDLGRSRLFFHNNYESSVDTTDSESSVSSHEHDHLLIDRLKAQHCSRPMDSSTEENVAGGGCGGGGGGAVELDWEKFSCPFNFGALDHTFTLNPYDVIYASKYLARNQSKTDTQEAECATGEEPPGAHDQYPYDPDPDATVV